jgi:hypothetical protein
LKTLKLVFRRATSWRHGLGRQGAGLNTLETLKNIFIEINALRTGGPIPVFEFTVMTGSAPITHEGFTSVREIPW